MNIGLVVYSWSGNTLSVAEKLKAALIKAGHTATLEQVTLVGERKQGDRSFEIDHAPDPSTYDAVIFGSAVEAFSLSPVLSAYLKRLSSLEGKKVGCLVSQQFPYAWMGGNRAIRQMKTLCKAKGGSIIGSGVVHWAKAKRETSTAAAVKRLVGAF